MGTGSRFLHGTQEWLQGFHTIGVTNFSLSQITIWSFNFSRLVRLFIGDLSIEMGAYNPILSPSIVLFPYRVQIVDAHQYRLRWALWFWRETNSWFGRWTLGSTFRSIYLKISVRLLLKVIIAFTKTVTQSIRFAWPLLQLSNYSVLVLLSIFCFENQQLILETWKRLKK